MGRKTVGSDNKKITNSEQFSKKNTTNKNFSGIDLGAISMHIEIADINIIAGEHLPARVGGCISGLMVVEILGQIYTKHE